MRADVIPNPDDITAARRAAYLDEQPAEEFLGPRGVLRWHTAQHGKSAHRSVGYYWPAPAPKAVVILVHGQGSYLQFDYLKNQVGAWVCLGGGCASAPGSLVCESSLCALRATALRHACCAALRPCCFLLQGVGRRKTYAGSWVAALNAAGISCAGIDNRGCGRSDGLFGYMEDHQLWVQDLVRSCHCQSGFCLLS